MHILADGTLEDHAIAEKRLVRELDIGRTLFEPDLSENDLIERAYGSVAKRSHITRRTKVRHHESHQALTIGFAGNRRRSLRALRKAGVRRLVDVRLNNVSQLAGFTKKRDLPYFLRCIAGIAYVARTVAGPNQGHFGRYKKKRIDWSGYESQFKQLLQSAAPTNN